MRSTSSIELFWIPLGAGSPVVTVSGRMFEAIAAGLARRPRRGLYHAALHVHLPTGRYAIEQAPVPDDRGEQRGVVATGPVGVRAAGRWRLFRYEVRCWRDGVIPDLDFVVESPITLTGDPEAASRLVEVIHEVPTQTWGRDEAGVGDMWNSNSVVAWALTRAGIDARSVPLPLGGRAPGWNAGCVVAESTADSPYART